MQSQDLYHKYNMLSLQEGEFDEEEKEEQDHE